MRLLSYWDRVRTYGATVATVAQLQQERLNVIYFVQCQSTRAIKIGKSNDPAGRIRNLQTASHETLCLLGTMKGDEYEEHLLHALFDTYLIRGEWFRGEPALVEQVKALLIRKGTPATLEDDSRRRDGCRVGLRDLSVAVMGSSETFRVYGTQWDRDQEMRLILYPADMSRPSFGGNRLVVSGSEIRDWRESIEPLLIHDVSWSDCVLLDNWPVTCCAPEGSIAR